MISCKHNIENLKKFFWPISSKSKKHFESEIFSARVYIQKDPSLGSNFLEIKLVIQAKTFYTLNIWKPESFKAFLPALVFEI